MASIYHPNIPALYEAAARFDFIVDTRGVYPTMIRGVKAKQYRTHRDMLDFISVYHVEPTSAPYQFRVVS